MYFKINIFSFSKKVDLFTTDKNTKEENEEK